MAVVGIRELKNSLTRHIALAKRGETIIVTDRNEPVAVLHGLGQVEADAGPEEVLASLARRGLVRFPVKRVPLAPIERAPLKGKKASEIIIEERR